MKNKFVSKILFCVFVFLLSIVFALTAFAKMTIDPINDASPGSKVTVSGKTDLEEIIVNVYSDENILIFIDVCKVQNGSFKTWFNLPGNASGGSYRVIAGKEKDLSAVQFNVALKENEAKSAKGTPSGGSSGNSAAKAIKNAVSFIDERENIINNSEINVSGEGINISLPKGTESINCKIDLDKFKKEAENQKGYVTISADKASVSIPIQVISAATEETQSSTGIKPQFLKISLSALESNNADKINREFSSEFKKAQLTSSLYALRSSLTDSEDKAVDLGDMLFKRHWKVNINTAQNGTMAFNYQDNRFLPVLSHMGVSGTASMKVMHNGIFGAAYYAPEYKDILNHWGEKNILSASSKYYVQGMSENLFSPDTNVTRGEFSAMLVNMLGLPLKYTNSFHDVSEGEWYYTYISTAKEKGLLNFESSMNFNPNAPLTREEMSYMLSKALLLMDKSSISTYDNNYSDSGSIGEDYKDTVSLCRQFNLMVGAEGYFRPKDYATRAEAVTVLLKISGIIVN